MQWDVVSEWEGGGVEVVMSSFKSAIQYDKKWAKAWHWWALANFELASYLDGKKRQQGLSLSFFLSLPVFNGGFSFLTFIIFSFQRV